MNEMTWAQACARRLRRHGLAEPAPRAALGEQVGAICGAHAQVLSAAELSIGLRVAETTRADVRAALWDERTLVKTFGPRGTVHLLPTEELPLWTGALAAIPATGGGLPRELTPTADQVDAIVAAIADALADAELTVDELTEAIVERAGAWAGERVMPAFQDMWPRWRLVTNIAAHRGALCFGADRGRRVTYTNPHRWLPGFAPLDEDEALAELVRRYLSAYGPATPQHFARWLAAPRGWATALFERLGEELEPVLVEGERMWTVAGDGESGGGASSDGEARGGARRRGRAASGGVRLLPYFDAYGVGCHPRERVFPGRAAERALARGQAGNYPVLLVDGVVAGVWHGRRSGRRLDVTVEPLHRLSAARRGELEAQVERVGEVLEARPRLTIGEVSVGPHA